MASDVEERLAAIRQRCEAATPGPWYATEAQEWTPDGGAFDDWGAHIGTAEGRYDVVVGGLQDEQGGAVGVRVSQDAEFIAHSREDLPWLLAENERLRLCCEALRDALHRYGETKRLNWHAAVEMIDAALGEDEDDAE